MILTNKEHKSTMLTKFRVEEKVIINKRVRSGADVLRLNLQTLETKMSLLIQSYDRVIQKIPESREEMIAYLTKLIQEIHKIQQGNNKKVTSDYINKVNALQFNLSKKLNQLNSNLTHKSTYFNPHQPYFEYGKFLQSGIKIYINIIDGYNLWLQPDELYPIIKNKHTLLHHVFMAVLARYTLSKNKCEFKFIYGTSLRNIKLSLPKSYENPSYYNVIGLGLLSYLALSHLKLELAAKYFTLAVRMAQALKCDEELQEETIILNEEQKKEMEKRSGLWKALSLTYLVMTTIIPDLNLMNFQPKYFELDRKKQDELVYYQKNQEDQSKGLRKEQFFSSKKGNVLTQYFIKINQYVYQVKGRYSGLELNLISCEELRLPKGEFEIVLKDLLNIEKESEDNIKGRDEVDDNLYFKLILQIQFIQLCYPNLIIYPKLVFFNRKENQLLFEKCLNFISYFCKLYFDNNTREKVVQFQIIDDNHYSVSNTSPQFLECFPVIFTLLNIISQAWMNHLNDDISFNNITQQMIIKSKKKVEFLLNLVFTNYQQNKQKQKDCFVCLKKIKASLYRFPLSEGFLKKINNYLNI
ncbi:hypothetical protein K502DRAFT_349300 [Neoconidiobolus thromboides FSU 785]|nr:hypothetical protein K502DRAFT_349300 [Neoconidiobolus thromboides FSU 785]